MYLFELVLHFILFFRYALQLITTSSLRAGKKRLASVTVNEVNEMVSLFKTAKESAQLSEQQEEAYWKIDTDDDIGLEKE
jgi:hypothetical protein